MSIIDLAPTVISWDSKPKNDTLITASAPETEIEKFPSISVITPLVVLTSRIVAPGIVSPVSSVTVPVIVCWAKLIVVINRAIDKEMDKNYL